MARDRVAAYRPRILAVEGFLDDGAIEAVEAELQERAEADPNQCFSYIPGMSGKAGIDLDLPACKEFAERYPTILPSGFRMPLGFNFLIMSRRRQEALSPYHLDSDDATALTGDVATVADRVVWRFLMNLSSRHARTISFLDINPFDPSVELEAGDGYIHMGNTAVNPNDIRTIAIPPRVGGAVSGVLLSVSQVLHSGRDDEYGRFVVSYGAEEPA